MPQAVNKVAGILLLFVLICVGTTLLTPGFMSPFNVQNNVRYIAQYGIIGIGVAFVIMTGGIDLSIGSVIGLVGCLLPMFLVEWGWSIPLSLAMVLLVSLAIGMAHGLLVTRMKLQPFIVTLCGLLIYRGLARGITGDTQMGFGSQYDESLRLLAIGKPCSFALLFLFTGLAMTAWFAWRILRQSRTSGAANRSASLLTGGIGLPVVLLITGLMLAIVGGSRFMHTYQINWGDPLFSLGPIDIPTWWTTVTAKGIAQPAKLMEWAGLAMIPGVLWLLGVIVFPKTSIEKARRTPITSLLPALASVGMAGLLVYSASQLADALADVETLAETSRLRLLPGIETWTRTWRIASVFVSLAAMMGALAWFAQRTLKVAGSRAIPPLLLTSVGAVFYLLGQTPLGQTLVPAPMLMLIVLSGLSSLFLNQTIYGRYLLALGNNEEAARFSGIQTDQMILLSYVLCSLVAGLGGILFALDTNAIQPQTHGNFYELYAIAAAVLGGCSLRGGEGTIAGVVIGAALIRILYNSINLIGLPPQMEFAIIGTVILLGVLADEIVKRVIARGRATADE